MSRLRSAGPPGVGFDQGKAVSCHVKASGSGSGRRPWPHGLQDPRGATFPSLQVKIRYRAASWGYFSIFLFFPRIIAPKYLLFGGVKGPTFVFQIYIFSQKDIEPSVYSLNVSFLVKLTLSWLFRVFGRQQKQDRRAAANLGRGSAALCDITTLNV